MLENTKGAIKIGQSIETGNIGYTGQINVREYQRGNQKRTIHRNWQHKVYKRKKNKTKTQHNMCWTPLYANKQLEAKTNRISF